MSADPVRGRGIRPALLCLLQLTAGGVAAQKSYFDMPLVELLSCSGDYRLYGKFFRRDGNHSDQLDRDSADDWQSGRLGFRLELSPDGADSLSVQGEYYDGTAGETSRVFAVTPPCERLQDREQQISGGHLLTRWSQDLSDARDLSVQFYYDRSERRAGMFSQTHYTLDLDLQLRDRHWAGHLEVPQSLAGA
jgi:hypothetical protein